MSPLREHNSISALFLERAPPHRTICGLRSPGGSRDALHTASEPPLHRSPRSGLVLMEVERPPPTATECNAGQRLLGPTDGSWTRHRGHVPGPTAWMGIWANPSEPLTGKDTDPRRSGAHSWHPAQPAHPGHGRARNPGAEHSKHEAAGQPRTPWQGQAPAGALGVRERSSQQQS